jgi:hypothetical protein
MFMKYSAVRRLRSSGGALLFAMIGCSGGNSGTSMNAADR